MVKHHGTIGYSQTTIIDNASRNPDTLCVSVQGEKANEQKNGKEEPVDHNISCFKLLTVKIIPVNRLKQKILTNDIYRWIYYTFSPFTPFWGK